MYKLDLLYSNLYYSRPLVIRPLFIQNLDYPELKMTILLKYFNRALYINVWASESIIQTIRLSERFIIFWDQGGSDNWGSTVIQLHVI